MTQHTSARSCERGRLTWKPGAGSGPVWTYLDSVVVVVLDELLPLPLLPPVITRWPASPARVMSVPAPFTVLHDAMTQAIEATDRPRTTARTRE